MFCVHLCLLVINNSLRTKAIVCLLYVNLVVYESFTTNSIKNKRKCKPVMCLVYSHQTQNTDSVSSVYDVRHFAAINIELCPQHTLRCLRQHNTTQLRECVKHHTICDVLIMCTSREYETNMFDARRAHRTYSTIYRFVYICLSGVKPTRITERIYTRLKLILSQN